MTIARTIVVGSRSSRLAQWQTEHVMHLIVSAWPGLSYRVTSFTTQGDRLLGHPLPEIGGKGLFTGELEQALRAGEIDLAVHSLKDLPVDNAPGTVLGAICSRDDVRDALVAPLGVGLLDLPAGATVGTSSIRRQAQLLALRPDLAVRSIRGNVETRLRKVLEGEYDATILAAAGLRRLQLDAHVTEWLDLEIMLPAPGQAALAVQCRAGDDEFLTLLAAIDDVPVRRAVSAERAFLSDLGGGCSAPVAAFAEVRSEGLFMRGLVATPDGRRVIRVEAQGAEPHALGAELAQIALGKGAQELLGG